MLVYKICQCLKLEGIIEGHFFWLGCIRVHSVELLLYEQLRQRLLVFTRIHQLFILLDIVGCAVQEHKFHHSVQVINQ